MASRNWPRYEVGRRDYIFALGVLAANFNELEGVLSLLFTINVRLPYAAKSLLFQKADNAQRINIIRGCLSITPWNQRDHVLPYKKREKEAIEHFLRGYAICAENRNILLHSEIYYGGTADDKRRRVIFYKDSRKPPHFPNRYMPSLKALRAIADAMHSFSEYGSDLAWMLSDTYWREEELGLQNLRKPLPHKPPLPKLLVPKPFEDSNPPKADQRQP